MTNAPPDFLKDFMVHKPPTPPVLKRWSFSTWSQFKECPYCVYASQVLKIQGKSIDAAIRGVAVHKAAEDYMNGLVTDCDPRAKAFLDRLKSDGYVASAEASIFLDADWKPCSKPDRKLTTIMDVFATKGSKVLIGDYKTGKKSEIKHTQQAQLYAAAVHKAFGYTDITAEFVYLDSGDSMVIEFTPKLLEMALKFWQRQGELLLSYPKEAFAPPDNVDTVPKWIAETLKNPDIYNDAHFKRPWYATN
jgi:RecB family exonuclease